jgi:hypothetical protein
MTKVRLFLAVGAALACMFPAGALADGIQVVPDTAVLLSNTTGSGGGGNGGNTSSASNATNIFSPASYVDYHEIGGEPTTVVDRYLFGPGRSPSCALLGTVSGTNAACQQQAACPIGQTNCYHDLVYVSNPIGLPTYSEFYKSSDGGQTFRVPAHNPYFFNQPVLNLGGGGDSHHAVGEITHSVFFTDLSGGCVTMNVSRDLGESFSSNPLGCEFTPGAIDDRQWVETDETAPDGQDVFMNFNNDTIPFVTGTGPASMVLVKSTNDGGANTPADWAASPCNETSVASDAGALDATPTSCPDPSDPDLWIAGPIVADKHGTATRPPTHNLYIPFERLIAGNFWLYIAKSTDEGNNWIRIPIRNLGPRDPANIFPQLTIDFGGNLYFTWSQAQRYLPSAPENEGETDAYYTYSTDGGSHWVDPINLTKESRDSAVFPWMVAGSPGQVDLVLYKANSGLNPNIAFYDSSGQSCDPTTATGPCSPNTTVWNTYFGQSQNALNSGPNFKLVQISDHPIHTGGICTNGLACQSVEQQNRDLLDFLTIDVDHTGAAYTTWASDNNARHDTRQYFSRQLSGNSIFKGQNIAAMNSYPITDHSVTDVPGDVFNAAGLPTTTACPSMDLRGASATRNSDTLTVTVSLDAPPSATAAITCASTPPAATGGLWGVEFWAASPKGPVPAAPNEDTNQFGNADFYLAYRDNPGDADRPTPGVEAGLMNSISPSLTHFEFHRYEDGAPVGGTCFSLVPPSPCTIVMTASLSGLGIKSGSILSSVSGLSVYFFGSEQQPPGLRIPLGNSNLADTATPFDVNGTGTTTK